MVTRREAMALIAAGPALLAGCVSGDEGNFHHHNFVAGRTIGKSFGNVFMLRDGVNANPGDVVLCTQNPNEVVDIARTVAVMQKGRYFLGVVTMVFVTTTGVKLRMCIVEQHDVATSSDAAGCVEHQR